MRGKLRDKQRTTAKREIIKREVIERRRPSKRDNRVAVWLNQQDADDYELADENRADTKFSRTKYMSYPEILEQGFK